MSSCEKNPARIVLVSGSPGTGKTTIARLLAEQSDCACAVHMHTDDFYGYIHKGYLPPWEKNSGDQNETVIDAVVASAHCYWAGGYDVYVDGVIGSWFVEPWAALAGKGVDVRYVVLRPDVDTTIHRAANREHDFQLTDEVVRAMWESFSDMGDYAAHVIDTTGQTVEDSVAFLQKALRDGTFRL